MSNNVKSWYIAFITIFSIIVTFCSLLISFKNNYTFNVRVVLWVATSLMSILPIICCINVIKYFKIEHWYRDMENNLLQTKGAKNYIWSETYDWKSYKKSHKNRTSVVNKKVWFSFVTISSILLTLLEIGFIIVFSLII